MEPEKITDELVHKRFELNFHSLSFEGQQHILRRIRGETEGIVFPKGSVVSAFVGILLCIVWLVFLYIWSDNYLWSTLEIALLSVLSFTTILVGILGFWKALKWFSSPLKLGLIVTPSYVIEYNYSDLDCRSLELLVSATRNSINSSSDSSRQIILSFENDSKSAYVSRNQNVDDVLDTIAEYRKHLVEAIDRDDTDLLKKNDDFIELKTNGFQCSKPSNKYLGYSLLVIGSAILAFGMMIGAISFNNHYDDRRSWNDAESQNRASSYRKYLQTHSQGRWIKDADENLQRVYDEAENKYQQNLNDGFDPKAVEAVKQIIRFAKDTKNYRVKLVFERKNLIPPDIVEILKKENEVKKILEFGDSFSSEKIELRETLLASKIAEAFNAVIPDDILEFSNDCNENCITFNVRYTIDSDTIYFNTLEEKVPEVERIWRPAVWFDWDFTITTLSITTSYDFQLSSDPAIDIFYESNIDESDVGKDTFEKKMEAEKNLFFDAVVASAFDDFKANLVYRMGIGEKPKRESVDEQSQIEKPSEKLPKITKK